MTPSRPVAAPVDAATPAGPNFVTDMGFTRLAIFTGSTMVAAILLAKLVIGLPLPNPGHIIPIYIVVAGLDLVLIGLLCVDIRGVVLTAVGVMLAAAGAVIALVDATGRTQALFFGAPLFTVAAAGAGIFGHGTIHARPTLVLWGARIAIAGFGISVLAILYGLVIVIGRERYHGDPVLRIGLGFVEVITVGIAVAAVFVRGELLERIKGMLGGGRK